MGFFNKPDTPAAALAPLSNERIKAALEAQSWRYHVDEDGEVNGGWEDGFFYFLTRGQQSEIFYVRGTWYGKLPEAAYAHAQQVCSDWNEETLWPKTYARRTDEGQVRVHVEHTVDYEYGLTDQQLQQHLVTVINTGSQFFGKLNETFPEAAAAYKSE